MVRDRAPARAGHARVLVPNAAYLHRPSAATVGLCEVHCVIGVPDPAKPTPAALGVPGYVGLGSIGATSCQPCSRHSHRVP